MSRKNTKFQGVQGATKKNVRAIGLVCILISYSDLDGIVLKLVFGINTSELFSATYSVVDVMLVSYTFSDSAILYLTIYAKK